VAGITATNDDLVDGLASMALYGGIGIVMQALFLFLVERMLKGQLDTLLRSDRLDPLATTLATVVVAFGVVTAVAVS